ncbi:efflux RND transporter periplasmic adaptor subunit [Candidatus Parcubacteria bacterium]|nr:efflux RND transporter periplasmic adaptor subunit [Candidatus Parcubacteria bacterium]
MTSHKRTIWNRLFKTKTGIIFLALVVILVGYFLFKKRTPSFQFVKVERTGISETVSLTGSTASIQSVSLSFANSGTVTHIYSTVGKKVTAGTLLAELNTADLAAALRQAEATVQSQKARLLGLQTGSRPEDIASSQASYDKANQDLANLYNSVNDTSTDSYTKANDAVRTELFTFFSSGDSSQPVLNYQTSNNSAKLSAEATRVAARDALNDWQKELSTLSATTRQTDLENTLTADISRLNVIKNFLQAVSDTLTSNLDTTTLTTNKTHVFTAMTEVNTASKNLNTLSQNIASQKLTVTQLKAALDLKRAGSSPTDISAQQAEVSQAEAGVQSARARLQNSRIVAPISGTIAQFDAKIGQLATAGTTLISITGNGGFEVTAGVSETDIGKIALNDHVKMTLDAFPNETFNGHITYIAPAETVTQGVVNYEVKISFDKNDSRLKSGLTSNIVIETNRKENVLVLPQYAILVNDTGTFVQTVENGKTIDHRVTLGIQDENGNVEILNGVTDGEEVLNIGLKKK